MNGSARLLSFLKKLLIFLFSIFFLSIAVFYIARLAPGDPLISYYGSRVEKMSPSERSAAEAKLGLNEPIFQQYIRWIQSALHGDFGISYKYKMDVVLVIQSRIGNTLVLGGVGFLLIFILALLLGLLCAWFEDRLPDRILCLIGTFSSCIPEFWLSLTLIYLFSATLHWLPSSGAYSAGGNGGLPDRIAHLILPLSVVVLSHLWYYSYMVRNTLLEEIREDYVLFAKAKGLRRHEILFRHCLRNILPSYLNLMAISAPHILGGTYIVETVFSYPGIGALAYESARYKDYQLLMVLSLLSGALVMLCSMAAQTVSEYLDPRIRTEELPDFPEVRKL